SARTTALLLLGLVSSFFWAYFTYHGAKLTMVAVGGLWVTIYAFTLKNRWQKILLGGVLLGTIVLHFGYTLIMQESGSLGERQNEVLFNSSHLEQIVNDQRRLSLMLPFDGIITNKVSVLIREVIFHYASVFDIQRVFLNGYEGGFQFSLAVHGFFYVSSIVLIPLGIFWSWQKNRQLTVVLLLVLLVSPVASAITISYQSIFRSALTYALLLLWSGLGLVAVFDWLSTQRSQWLV
ncbi:MAG: hypothetical protein M3Q81_00595, partial [bacterium]|nr:hypothetical protein [bacterium]